MGDELNQYGPWFFHLDPSFYFIRILTIQKMKQDWLPRRVMSASRVAGIIHASEGWDVNECGGTIFSIDKVWEASLENGFRPLSISA